MVEEKALGSAQMETVVERDHPALVAALDRHRGDPHLEFSPDERCRL